MELLKKWKLAAALAAGGLLLFASLLGGAWLAVDSYGDDRYEAGYDAADLKWQKANSEAAQRRDEQIAAIRADEAAKRADIEAERDEARKTARATEAQLTRQLQTERKAFRDAQAELRHLKDRAGPGTLLPDNGLRDEYCSRVSCTGPIGPD